MNNMSSSVVPFPAPIECQTIEDVRRVCPHAVVSLLKKARLLLSRPHGWCRFTANDANQDEYGDWCGGDDPHAVSFSMWSAVYAVPYRDEFNDPYELKEDSRNITLIDWCVEEAALESLAQEVISYEAEIEAETERRILSYFPESEHDVVRAKRKAQRKKELRKWPHDYASDCEQVIGLFNDCGDTTHDDVLAVYDRAIAAEEARAA